MCQFTASSSSSSTMSPVHLFFLLALIVGISYSSTEEHTKIQRNPLKSPCNGNSPETRQSWCDYDIKTDYTTTTPNTGVTREFWLELDQAYLSPDGRKRWTLAINNTIPGPTLEVNWGDMVIVHFRNNIPSNVRNGTSMHFHGIRQHYTNPSDGVVSITQCPIAPGESMTYRWRATQYGTTWYHSHIGLQTWEGAFGGIIIHGPASANYDDDMGVILLNDWDARTVDELWEVAQTSGPPTLDNGLIHGLNVFGEDGDPDQIGHRFNMTFVPGRSYRLRLGNAACDTHFKFSIDHHVLTVIAADLVPIRPYNTTVLSIAIGQRYDVIVHANQASTASTFWLRAIPQTSCSKNSNAANIRGIITYETKLQDTAEESQLEPSNLPKTSPHNITNTCTDESPLNLIPMISPTSLALSNLHQIKTEYNKSLPIGITRDGNNHLRWTLNNTSMQLNWTNPTLKQIISTSPHHHQHQHDSDSDSDSASAFTFTRTDAVIALPDPDTWTLVIIETTLAAPHPIHLHGHDFLIVAQGPGSYRVPHGFGIPVGADGQAQARADADADAHATANLSSRLGVPSSSERSLSQGVSRIRTQSQSQSQSQSQTSKPTVDEANPDPDPGTIQVDRHAGGDLDRGIRSISGTGRVDKENLNDEGHGDGEMEIPFVPVSGSLPKRDTALLPGSGHLVIAFKTDNPGAWLLHCHIGWHLEQGFGVQFVEREDEMRGLFNGDTTSTTTTPPPSTSVREDLEGLEWSKMGEEIGERCTRWGEYWGKYGDENGSGV